MFEVTHYTRVKQSEFRCRAVVGKASLVHWPIAVLRSRYKLKGPWILMNKARRDRIMDPERRQPGRTEEKTLPDRR